jgi:uncharacterized protein (TIGR00251 family)
VIRFRIRLTPKGGRDAIDGWSDHLNERVLKARVTAPPEDGKANAALIALLAKALGIAKSRIAIVGGSASRLKSIEIEDNARDIAARLATLGEKP